MAATYEITDQTTHSLVILKESGIPIKWWSIPKTVSARVENGFLTIAGPETLKLPRIYITVPASTDDADLAAQVTFLSSGGGSGNNGNPLNFNYPSGSIQPFNYIYSGTNSSFSTNQLKGSFITVFSDVEIAEILIYPTIGAVGNSVWGVYELDPITGYPTNLLFQTAVINNNAVAVQATVFSPAKKLPKGIYLAAGITNSAASFQANNGVTPTIHPHGVRLGNFNNYIQGYKVAQAYSADLPSVFPSGAVLFDNEFSIKPAFKIL
jgi:hypothetical protein